MPPSTVKIPVRHKFSLYGFNASQQAYPSVLQIAFRQSISDLGLLIADLIKKERAK